jgi:hypothetical protein
MVLLLLKVINEGGNLFSFFGNKETNPIHRVTSLCHRRAGN